MIKRLAPDQKIRLIVGTMPAIQTSVYDIRSGLFEDYKYNTAAQKAVDTLEFTRSGMCTGDQFTTGVAGVWEGLHVLVDMQ
jgi:hypothetical protein